jgi:hypothetical protein
MACLLRAEALLATSPDGQLATVRTTREGVEPAHPGATAAARQSLTASAADALARYPAGLAP